MKELVYGRRQLIDDVFCFDPETGARKPDDNAEGLRISLEDVLAVAEGARVTFKEDVYEVLAERREQIVNYVGDTNQPAYGFNRGFGHLVDLKVPEDRLDQLQRNLIRSHACGVGDPAPIEVCRAAMFLRALSLARGNSGVRPQLVKFILEMLNARVCAVVPRLGSVGASGDLAPMSHLALAMLGEGETFAGIGPDAERMPAAEALKRVGLTPIKLEMKEGLALNNGVQFSNAIGILSYFKLKDLLKTAALLTATTAQLVLGSDTPFHEDLHALRPHPGALQVAEWIRTMMKGSPIREFHRPYDIDGEIQDPYNIRCAAQILGACWELLEEAATTFRREAASATDNPLILDLEEEGKFIDIVSGGHFHGMPVATKLYNLMQSMGIMARLSNMRCVRYVDSARNKGLGDDLKWPKLDYDESATCSGMMIPEYTSAAVTNFIWGACMPTHLMSMSTDAGQEDHVSMSAGLAVRVWETIPRLAEVLAMELAFACQAAAVRAVSDHIPSKKALTEAQLEATKAARDAYEEALREALKDSEEGKAFDLELGLKLRYRWKETDRVLSERCERVLSRAREIFPTVVADRFMGDQLTSLSKSVLSGEFVRLAGL